MVVLHNGNLPAKGCLPEIVVEFIKRKNPEVADGHCKKNLAVVIKRPALRYGHGPIWYLAGNLHGADKKRNRLETGFQ